MFKRKKPQVPPNKTLDELLEKIGKTPPVEDMTEAQVERENDKIDSLHIEQDKLDRAFKRLFR